MRRVFCGRSVLAVAALGAGAAAACGAFTEQAPAVDASSPPNDASSAIEASTDAGALRCKDRATAALLCLDFDDGKPATSGFESTETAASLDSTLFVSPPASLRVPGGEQALSVLNRVFQGSRTHYEVSTRLRVAAGDAGLTEFTIPLRLGFAQCLVELQLWHGGVLGVVPVSDGGADDYSSLLEKVAVGRWMLVDFRIDQEADGVWFELKLDGLNAIERRKSRCASIEGSVQLAIGASYATNAVVHFDDFVFDGR